MKVLASQQCGPHLIPSVSTICGLIEFVVGSHPCSKGFSPATPVFLPPQKQTFSNSNLIWKQWMKESHTLRNRSHWIFLFVFIYLFHFIVFTVSLPQKVTAN